MIDNGRSSFSTPPLAGLFFFLGTSCFSFHIFRNQYAVEVIMPFFDDVTLTGTMATISLMKSTIRVSVHDL